jgi:tyrosinase
LIAFDPIFWLHHSNVDRMLSLWYAIHYNTWVAKGSSENGTWSIPKGTNVDENTSQSLFLL